MEIGVNVHVNLNGKTFSSKVFNAVPLVLPDENMIKLENRFILKTFLLVKIGTELQYVPSETCKIIEGEINK